MREGYEWILSASVDGVPVGRLLGAAAALEAAGDPEGAAAALDQAHMLAPGDRAVAAERARVLDGLAEIVHGLRFCYVPDGAFWMGSEDGDPDEQPVHVRCVGGLWVAEEPMTLAAFEDLMGWHGSVPAGDAHLREEGSGVRYHYSTVKDDDEPLPERPPELTTPRRRAESNEKPMVASSYRAADAVAGRMATADWRFRLPSEAEWEKAARGGLVCKRYAWGDAPPTPEVCCFDEFVDFTITETRKLPPNGYGLRAMCGSVWEWTTDRYDALAYRSGRVDPAATERVLRGGSWADMAPAVTVSFRMSLAPSFEYGFDAPTVGFRLCAERISPRRRR